MIASLALDLVPELWELPIPDPLPTGRPAYRTGRQA